LSQTPRIIADKETLEHSQFVTINGRLIPKTGEDFMKLCFLAYRFRESVRHELNLVFRDVPQRDAYKELAKMLPSSIYGETAYKYAKLLAEGSKGKIKVRRICVASRGGVTWGGNLNIRLASSNRVLVRYYGGEWIELESRFGKKYIPLIEELIELVNGRKESYGVAISFRNGKIYIHLEVPLHLYLKHFSEPKQRGYNLVAGFDVNSDRVNVAVLDFNASIVALRTFWYSEVTSHGLPAERARWIRLNALSNALKWCRSIGVDFVVFEDLTKVKKRRFTGNSNANRKISKFAKKQIIRHGVLKALKTGFTVTLINPKKTTNSLTHKQIMKEKGLDRHMASAYITAYRGIKKIKEQKPATTPPT